MDESSLVAAAFPFFFRAAAFPLGAVAFGAVASFLESGAAFGCIAARRLRSGFATDAAEVTVALALLLLLGNTVAAVTGAPYCLGLSSSSLLLSSSSDYHATLAKGVNWALVLFMMALCGALLDATRFCTLATRFLP